MLVDMLLIWVVYCWYFFGVGNLLSIVVIEVSLVDVK